MLNFVLGPSGSGKTKWLIDKANEEVRKGNGNIIFIDTDDCKFKKDVETFCEKHNLEVFMGINIPKEELCEGAQATCVELKLD